MNTEWIHEIVKEMQEGEDPDTIEIMIRIIEELPMPLHPIYGIYAMEPQPKQPNTIPDILLNNYSMIDIFTLEKLIQTCYSDIRHRGYFPESLVMTCTMMLFERKVVVDYGDGSLMPKDGPMTVHTSLLVPYHLDATHEEMVDITLGCARRVSQRAVQTFAQVNVKGFATDPRGFVSIDGEVVPDEIQFFLNFLADNTEEMGGIKQQKDGRPLEELIEEGIQEHMETFVAVPEDYKNTSMFELDVDPDSEENNDEVVRW